MYDTILIPIDGSDDSKKGLQIGCALADAYQSKVILLCVAERNLSDDTIHGAVDEGLIKPVSYQDVSSAIQYPEVSMTLAEENRQFAVEQVASVLAEKVVAAGKTFTLEKNVPEVLTLVRDGDPADCITSAANSYNADLVVIGAHDHKGLSAFFHTGVAEHVRKHADCSCLLLTPPHK